MVLINPPSDGNMVTTKQRKTEDFMMRTAYTFREEIKDITIKYGTEINKSDFEMLFTRTKESVKFSFNGWDGKSYNGECRTAKILRVNFKGYENCRFIKVGNGIHMINENDMVLEKATGEYHNSCNWAINVARA
jgi:hypothetical protein